MIETEKGFETLVYIWKKFDLAIRPRMFQLSIPHEGLKYHTIYLSFWTQTGDISGYLSQIAAYH
jgi:hypothetical protein